MWGELFREVFDCVLVDFFVEERRGFVGVENFGRRSKRAVDVGEKEDFTLDVRRGGVEDLP